MIRRAIFLLGLTFLSVSGCQSAIVPIGDFQIGAMSASLSVSVAASYRLQYVLMPNWTQVRATLTGPDGLSHALTSEATLDAAVGTRNARLVFTGLSPGDGYRLTLDYLSTSATNEVHVVSTRTVSDIHLSSGPNVLDADQIAPRAQPSLAPATYPEPLVTSLSPFGPPGRLGILRGVAADPNGRHFVLDDGAVRLVQQDSLGRSSVITLAGRSESLGTGMHDGTGKEAIFQFGGAPTGIVVSPEGVVYIADLGNHAIRALSLNDRLEATVRTIAGNGTPGYADGAGEVALFNSPRGLALDQDGSLIVADAINNVLRRITFDAQGKTTVSTIAGSIQSGYLNGPTATAQFKLPTSVAVDPQGRVFVGDSGNRRVRMISKDAQGQSIVSTIAGTGAAGQQDGTGMAASFGNIPVLHFGKDGNLYAIDSRVRRLNFNPDSTVTVTTIVGGGGLVGQDGPGLNVSLNTPAGLTWNPSGQLVVATKHTLLNVANAAATATVSKLFGDYRQTDNLSQDGPAVYDLSFTPNEVIVDKAGNLFFSTLDTFQIFKLDRSKPGLSLTLIAGDGTTGYQDGEGRTAKFGLPQNIVVTDDGSLYVPDMTNHCIRKLSPTADGKYVVTTFAGDPNEAAHTDGSLADTRFLSPMCMIETANGDFLVADKGNNTIRKISMSQSSPSSSTFAGYRLSSGGYIDGPILSSRFGSISGIAEDSKGNLYVSDTSNFCIRKISFDAQGSGTVSTFAGGVRGFQDGALTTARFNKPWQIVYSAANNCLYLTDDFRLRKIALDTPDSTAVQTLAGSDQGYADGYGKSALFGQLIGIALDSSGNILLSDQGNRVIRQVLTR